MLPSINIQPRTEDDVRLNLNNRNSTSMNAERPPVYPNQNSYINQRLNVNPGPGSGPGMGYYSTGGSSIGGGGFEQDNRSIASTPSKISKFTYSGIFFNYKN